MIKFSELKEGDLFNYDGSEWKKFSDTLAQKVGEYWIYKSSVTNIPPDTLVEKIKPTRPERKRK